jgi:GR25 family glycosyltransferase involved in LPS biosynthesis
MITALIIKVEGQGSPYVEKLLSTIEETESEINPEILSAATPETINQKLREIETIDADSVNWTYPLSEQQDRLDIGSGMYLRHYRAKDQKKVIACMVSHMMAWDKVFQKNEPMIVFEHDAVVYRKITKEKLMTDLFRGGVLGLNDPRGATRKSALYHEKLSKFQGIQKVPLIDGPSDPPLPSGLAGNSAYLITPFAAKALLDKVAEVGMWPNDALMCRQFFPWLQVTYPYFTKVQGVVSTTTT